VLCVEDWIGLDWMRVIVMGLEVWSADDGWVDETWPAKLRH
jgi:hypothetical protein